MAVKITKSIFVLTASAALGIGAYAAYRYWKQRRDSKCIDEGFEDVSKEVSQEKRVLVLGLQSAGKTTLVSQLVGIDIDQTRATEGFNVLPLNQDDKVLNIWDVGGRENIRRFWSNFTQDTDVLIFVVDAADSHKIVAAVKEIKTLAGDERLKNVPFLVVASKQDLPGALTTTQIEDALDIKSIAPSKHKIKVFGTKLNRTQVDPTVLEVKKAMLEMV